MSPRERVTAAINFKESDRVPLDFGGDQTGINREAYQNLIQFLGLKEEIELIHDMGQVAKVSEEVLHRLEIDTRYIFPKTPFESKAKEVETDGTVYLESTDEWGIVRSKPKNYGHWYDITNFPLKEATLNDLDSYPWPNPKDPRRFNDLAQEAEKLFKKTNFAIATGVNGSMFEMAWYLLSMERFLRDMILNRSFVERMLDILLQFWLDFYEVFLKEVGDFIQIVNVGDDLGTQDGPMLSPELYRSLVKPHQKILFKYIHEHTNAKLWYHSCGSVYPFIPDFIEIGVDILNPVQISAKGMDSKRLKKEFGNDIVFWGGGCDTQYVLPFKKPKEVEREVKTRIRDFAPGGGYVFTQVHDVPVEAPPQNVIIMFETAKKYGRYPINL